MSRVVITTPCTLAAGVGFPAQYLTKGQILEVTAAMAATIASAGGTSRPVGTTAHDQLGEAVGVSNGS